MRDWSKLNTWLAFCAAALLTTNAHSVEPLRVFDAHLSWCHIEAQAPYPSH